MVARALRVGQQTREQTAAPPIRHCLPAPMQRPGDLLGTGGPHLRQLLGPTGSAGCGWWGEEVGHIAATRQGGQLSGAASDVASADQDIQAVMQQLDAAQSDASADLSAQDAPVEP